MPTLSILVPLNDVRTCGWDALASAVAHGRTPGEVEVVAVLGRPDPAAPPAPTGLLDAPHVVEVRTDADAANPDHEIRFYTAGVARATGELIFFAEGHTVLFPHAAGTILDWFAQHPLVDAAWVPRINRQRTPLGELVGLNNAQADVIARGSGRGLFSFGANSIVRRARVDALGGFDASLGRVRRSISRCGCGAQGLRSTRFRHRCAIMTTTWRSVSSRRWRRSMRGRGGVTSSARPRCLRG